MQKTKLTGRAVSIPAGLALGALVSMSVTLLITAIGAHMIVSENISQENTGYCAITALLSSTVLGAITASKKIKRQKLLVCMLSGAVYFCLLLSMTALFFGGQYEGLGVTLLIIMLGSLAAALITVREGKINSHHKRKNLHR